MRVDLDMRAVGSMVGWTSPFKRTSVAVASVRGNQGPVATIGGILERCGAVGDLNSCAVRA